MQQKNPPQMGMTKISVHQKISKHVLGQQAIKNLYSIPYHKLIT